MLVAALGQFGLWSAPVSADAGVTVTSSGCAGGSSFCFVPSAVSTASGTTVTWTNQTTASHTVTRCTPVACMGVDGGTGTDSTFTSMNLDPGPGTTAVHTFSGAGTYNYYCQIHGYAVMHGTVTVTAATTTTAGPTTAPPSTAPPTTAAAPPPTTAPAAPAPATPPGPPTPPVTAPPAAAAAHPPAAAAGAAHLARTGPSRLLAWLASAGALALVLGAALRVGVARRPRGSRPG